MDKVEDVIELLESVKNWTDPVSDEHPFGTVDYMQIDSAIEFLRGLTMREADVCPVCKGLKIVRNDDGLGSKECSACNGTGQRR